MKYTCLGAAHEVTGSAHLLEAAGKRILVDCGLEQGQDLYENPGMDQLNASIDLVLLTHAHIDHSGKLPLLVKNGFKGQIITTYPTADLCNIMLRDSAHIQEFEAEWHNRKGKRSGQPEYEPLYVMQDALDAIELITPVNYNERITVCDGVQVRFTDVGHLLGSASIEVWITEKVDETTDIANVSSNQSADHKANVSKNSFSQVTQTNGMVTTKIVFSGDLGNINQPIIKDPSLTTSADYVVVESTYGDRLHGTEKIDYVADFTRILHETFDKGGNVVVPSFAVGRTQELLYFIREIKEKNLLPEYSNFEVYVDSPLAIEATKIFRMNMRECFDEEAMALVDSGVNPLVFPGLKIAESSDDSKNINLIDTPKVIISASGMCDAGRIRHHLKHNLWRAECTILFVGYQAVGTLGRSIVDGQKQVKIFGEEITIRARIESLHGISGHADQAGLLHWLKGFESDLRRVIVVHGEDAVTDTFAELVREELGVETWAPYPSGCIDLYSNTIVEEGSKEPIKPKKALERRQDAATERLVGAGRKLLEVIYQNEGITNKDKAKFESQIRALIEKWSVGE